MKGLLLHKVSQQIIFLPLSIITAVSMTQKRLPKVKCQWIIREQHAMETFMNIRCNFLVNWPERRSCTLRADSVGVGCVCLLCLVLRLRTKPVKEELLVITHCKVHRTGIWVVPYFHGIYNSSQHRFSTTRHHLIPHTYFQTPRVETVFSVQVRTSKLCTHWQFQVSAK